MITRDSAVFFVARQVAQNQVNTKITCISVINDNGTPCVATFLPPIWVANMMVYGAMMSTEIEVPTI